MVFETLGAVNEEGQVVLKQLFSFAAKELGREFTSFCSRAWVQRSVAQGILNRIDGNNGSTPVHQEPSVGEPVEEPFEEKGEEVEEEKKKVALAHLRFRSFPLS